MPCYHPITAYRSAAGRNKDTGKWPLVFDRTHGFVDMPVTVPCGKCIGCRLEKSRQWAIRCVHEASLYQDNCFVTLTYDDAHLPYNRSVIDYDTGELLSTLDKRDFQLFMKRLRKEFGSGIRFFHCGEYGSLNFRPHHHACLFNVDFKDKVLWSVRRGVKLYRSATLERLWPFGFCTVGEVNFESAAYVARYVLKKITGDKADEHYKGREPEYITMSRRPGIGRDWFEKYSKDVFPDDKCVIRDGLICKPPKYYDYIYDLTNHDDFVKIKARRIKLAARNPDNTLQRLTVREVLCESRAAKLIRNL